MLRHEITIVIGRTGSGKTQLIAREIGPSFPRRITFDSTGECRKLYPDAFYAYGLEQAFSAMAFWRRHDMQHWHLVLACQPSEAAQLMAKLVPVHDGRTLSVAEAFGGLCVECFELDIYAPNHLGAENQAWKNAFLRGRHVGCSLLVATQRPQLVDRVATSQAGRIITFAMFEPAELKYLEGAGGSRFRDLAQRLPRFHSAWLHKDTWRIEHRDSDYQVIRSWTGQEQYGGGE